MGHILFFANRRLSAAKLRAVIVKTQVEKRLGHANTHLFIVLLSYCQINHIYYGLSNHMLIVVLTINVKKLAFLMTVSSKQLSVFASH